MKVALVFDIPDDIEIEKTKAQYITIAGKKTNNYMVQTMKIDCQLRPLPDKLIPEMVLGNAFARGCCQGWNDCINEITGETDDSD